MRKRKISYKSFLKILADSPRKWKLKKSIFKFGEPKTIRLGNSDKCPLEFVVEQTGAHFGTEPTESYFSFNIDEVIAAADNYKGSRYFSPRVRRDLLCACGLSETS